MIPAEAVEAAEKIRRVLDLIDDLFIPGYYPPGVSEAVTVLHEALIEAEK